MQRSQRNISLLITLFLALVFFIFAGAESYAAEVIFDENTTQLQNGNRYFVSGEIKIDSRIEVDRADDGYIWYNRND